MEQHWRREGAKGMAGHTIYKQESLGNVSARMPACVTSRLTQRVINKKFGTCTFGHVVSFYYHQRIRPSKLLSPIPSIKEEVMYANWTSV